MKLLPDTPVFLFAINEPERLSPKVQSLLLDPTVPRWFSAISLWEIAMLNEHGRIKLQQGAQAFLDDLLLALKLNISPINTEIAALAQTACPGHHDPADRLIAATAIYLDAPLVTRDEKLAVNKRIKIVW